MHQRAVILATAAITRGYEETLRSLTPRGVSIASGPSQWTDDNRILQLDIDALTTGTALSLRSRLYRARRMRIRKTPCLATTPFHSRPSRTVLAFVTLLIVCILPIVSPVFVSHPRGLITSSQANKLVFVQCIRPVRNDLTARHIEQVTITHFNDGRINRW